jgi:hypothetical protein
MDLLLAILPLILLVYLIAGLAPCLGMGWFGVNSVHVLEPGLCANFEHRGPWMQMKPPFGSNHPASFAD